MIYGFIIAKDAGEFSSIRGFTSQRAFGGILFPFLGLPHEELALLSVWKPQDGLTMGKKSGVWGAVISWNGLRPAGMQLNGTNAQKEWQAPASGPLGGGLGAGMSFFKALRT